MFVEEPVRPDHPLLKLDQVICTPHLGAATEEAQINVAVAIVLRGLLNRVLDSNVVNYVNAPAIARERGINVVESRTTQPKGFSNLITVTAATSKGLNVVAGAVFGQRVIRLVRINNFFLDADPEGYILMLHNRDVPGVVGSVGTLLGEAKINIARLELGREHIGGMAVSLVHVDDAIPDTVLEHLRTQPNIVSAHLIKL